MESRTISIKTKGPEPRHGSQGSNADKGLGRVVSRSTDPRISCVRILTAFSPLHLHPRLHLHRRPDDGLSSCFNEVELT